MAVLRWGSATHEGQLRAQNEDNMHAGNDLFVVADGMGGHLAGEVASEMTIDRLNENLPANTTNSLDELVAAINEANTEIFENSLEHADRAGMGTTVTAIAVVDDPYGGEVFGVANVGDSRIYVLRHQQLRQVSIDHSFVQELVAEGAISRDEARTHPRRNIVTRALGIEPLVRVDSWTMPIIRGDRFILCSDGLVDEVPDGIIKDIVLAHVDDPEAAAQALVDAANEAGGRDNITVVVVDVIEGDDPPDPTLEFDVVPLWSDDDLDNTGETQIITDPSDDELAQAGANASAQAGGTTQAVGADDEGSPEADATPATPPHLYDGGEDVPRLPPAQPAAAPVPPARSGRGGRFIRFVLGVGVAAVLIIGFAVLAAWARNGYFVAFNASGEVAIYQGRKETVLWFNPTEESTGQYTIEELDESSIQLVMGEPEFSSQASAELFVSERLTPVAPDGADDDTSGPATTAPNSTPPTTARPNTTTTTATTSTTEG